MKLCDELVKLNYLQNSLTKSFRSDFSTLPVTKQNTPLKSDVFFVRINAKKKLFQFGKAFLIVVNY